MVACCYLCARDNYICCTFDILCCRIWSFHIYDAGAASIWGSWRQHNQLQSDSKIVAWRCVFYQVGPHESYEQNDRATRRSILLRVCLTGWNTGITSSHESHNISMPVTLNATVDKSQKSAIHRLHSQIIHYKSKVPFEVEFAKASTPKVVFVWRSCRQLCFMTNCHIYIYIHLYIHVYIYTFVHI